MLEIWKDIPGYEGFYEISNTGKVKSVGRIDCYVNHKGNTVYRNIKERILKTYYINSGYQCVVLAREGDHKKFLIHKLVATAFIPNPNKLTWVNHCDGYKTNNCVTNLVWCTPTENIIHAYTTGLMKKGANHKDARTVVMHDGKKDVREFGTLRLAAEAVGVHNASISSACKLGHKSGGFYWRYKT
jgi:hypothetical protein